MFLAHFGVGLAAKAVAPRVSLGTLLFAAQFQLASALGPPPGVAAVAWAGQAQWPIGAWGWWIDRHRRAVRDAVRPATP